MPKTSRAMSIWMDSESKAQPPGLTSYGSGGGPLFSDAFRFRRAPSLPALAEAFKSIIYMCVRLNSEAVARVPLRLYRLGSKKGDVAKSCDARPASKSLRLRLKAMAGAEEVEEITGDHPLLKLLNDVNPSMDHTQLIQYTAMSMDVVGTGFWWPTEYTKVGPQEVWPLPPHLVSPVMTGTGLVPEGYQFGAIQYRPQDLLIFKHLSMKNPYGLGMSPTQAAIEYARLEDTYVSVADDMMSNGPRPSVVISHKDPKGAFGAAERQRLEADMNTKGRGGRAGSAFVVDGSVSVTPISYSPADLSSQEMAKHIIELICGCFGVPVSMVTNESSNRAVAEAGLEQHARQAVEPRCKSIASVLTRWTHSLDKTGQRNWSKLVWAFDDVVEADKAAEIDRLTKAVAMGLPLNEALKEAGFDAVEGGDVSFVASTLTTLENAVKPPEPPVLPGQEPKPGEEDEAVEAKPAEPAEAADSPEEKAIVERLTKMITDLGTRVSNLS